MGTSRSGRSSKRGGASFVASFGSLALALTLLLGLPGCGGGMQPILPPGGPGTAASTSDGEAEWALELLDLTNAVRADHGLAPLTFDDAASEVAYEHCWDMDLRAYFEHVNPDGEAPIDRMARHGIVKPYVGENLARGHASAAEVVQAWMDSPPHRANLLYPGWTRVGIAVHAGPLAGPWWAAEYFN